MREDGIKRDCVQENTYQRALSLYSISAATESVSANQSDSAKSDSSPPIQELVSLETFLASTPPGIELQIREPWPEDPSSDDDKFTLAPV